MSASIIIPAYNAAGTVAEAVASALAQGNAVERVVVVDDGSTDLTGKRCEGFAVDPRFRLIRKPNGGTATARNAGAAECPDAAWFLFLDADDLLEPGAVSRLLHAAENASAAVTYGQVRMDGPSGKVRNLGSAAGDPPAPFLALLCRNDIMTPGCVLLEGSLFRASGGFDPKIRFGEDYAFWLKLGAGARFCFLPEPVLCKRRVPNAKTSDLGRTFRSAMLNRIKAAEDARNADLCPGQIPSNAALWHGAFAPMLNCGKPSDWFWHLRGFLGSHPRPAEVKRAFGMLISRVIRGG